MNIKCIVIGGLAWFVAVFVVGFATGPLIHEGVLDAPYEEHNAFWLEPLRQDPPDMAAMMPTWILHGLIGGFVVAGLYCYCGRSCCGGAGWKRGLCFGLGLGVFLCSVFLSLSGVFALSGTIFIWWGFDALINYCIAGAAMGWAVGKWCPE